MIVKFIMSAMLAFAAIGINCSAANSDILIDCADYTSSDVKIQVNTADGWNNNNIACITAAKTDTEYSVKYEVDAPQSGGYQLNIVSTSLNSMYTSPYEIRINGTQTLFPESDAEELRTFPQTIYSTTLSEYNVGIVYLNEGSNTVEIILDKTRKTDDNIIAYFDYMEFVPQEFDFDKIEAKSDLGIFTDIGDVEFDLLFKTNADKNQKYQYVVKDFNGGRVYGENVVLGAGSHIINIAPHVEDTGWYELILYDGINEIGRTCFSVIDEAFDSDLPFAMDFASAWLTDNERDISRLSDAARKVGISYIRERYRWNETEGTKGNYNFNITDYNIDAVDGFGFKKLAMFSDTPLWASESGFLCNDLFDIYEFQKRFAQRYGDTVSVMEVWNEEDTSFASETADEFAAFFKAAAIGIADGNADMRKTFGGFAQDPSNTDFIDILMQNDVMDYSDIYNYHSYTHGDEILSQNIDKIKAHRDLLIDYGFGDDERWVTEGGVGASDSDEKLQARAVITAYCQSFAYGVDKHFWFVLPYYEENTNQFGMFNDDNTPRPAYNALSVLTNMLGKAEYKGELYNMPSGVTGYIFDNGSNDTGVFWAERDTYVQFSSHGAVTVTDIMGASRTVYPVDGEINIGVSSYPVFVSFDGECDIGNIYKDNINSEHDTGKSKTFSDAQKIVLKQIFSGSNYNDPKKNGYSIYMGRDNICTVDVYNFSDKTQSGTIYASVTDGFSVSDSEKDVTVPAMGKVTVEFVINAESKTEGRMELSGTFGGEDISKSVSKLTGDDEEVIENYTVFENSKNAGNWYTNSISSGSCTARQGSDDEVIFDVNMGIGWCYPVFRLTSGEIEDITGSDGLVYWIYSDEDIPQTIQHIFVHLADGRKFYEGEDGRPVQKGWNQLSFRWDELVCQYVPDDLDIEDPDKFDLSDVTHISIGINSQNPENKTFSVRDVGYYVSDDELAEQSAEISFDTEDRSVLNGGNINTTISNISAEDNISVYLSGKCIYSSDEAECDKIYLSGNSGTAEVFSYYGGMLNGTVRLYSTDKAEPVTMICKDAQNNIKFADVLYTDNDGSADFSFINTEANGSLYITFNLPAEEKLTGSIECMQTGHGGINISYKGNGASFEFDTSELERGVYSLLVSVKEESGRVTRRSVDFYIDDRS